MVNISDEKISLANIGGGVAIERFDDELARALANIADPNTVEGAKREITLKVIIKPQDRSYATVEIHCSSKLAAAEVYQTNAYIGADARGRVEAFEHNPEQLKLQFEQRRQEDQRLDGNITVIHGKERIQ